MTYPGDMTDTIPMTDGTLLMRYDDHDRPIACWLVTSHRAHRVDSFDLERKDLAVNLPPDLLGKVNTLAPLPSVTIRTTKGATYHAPEVTVTHSLGREIRGRRARRIYLARPSIFFGPGSVIVNGGAPIEHRGGHLNLGPGDDTPGV